MAMARSVSHFGASGSWHRMLWPENLTAQECCACVSSGYAHLAGQAENSVCSRQTVSTPGLGHPSLTAMHTGSLVTSQHSSPSQNPMTHFLGPESSASLITQGCTYLLHSCWNCTSSQALRSGGQDTQWDPHLFQSSHILQPLILCLTSCVL